MRLASDFQIFQMYRRYLVLLGVFYFAYANAQSDLKIGDWQSHLPHNIAQHVEQSQDKIIYGTPQSVFSIDKSDMSITYLSKINGLSETGIGEMLYDDFNESLIIAYENSVIDIVRGSEVIPVFDVSNNSNFIDRKLNDLFVPDSEFLYIATGFGVLQYNLQELEFGFTMNAGQSVQKIDGNESFLVISADEGFYSLDLESTNFPNAFSSWTRLEGGLPTDYEGSDVLLMDELLYVATREGIYRSDDLNQFELVYTIDEASESVVFLKENGTEWVAGIKDNAFNSRLVIFDSADVPIDEIRLCTNRLLDVEIDPLGRIFFGDEWLSVRYIDESGNCIQDQFDGPYSIEASDICIKEDVAFVASGGITDNFADLFGRQGIYILEENRWNNINQDNNSFFADNNIVQFYQVEAHPGEDLLYIGSFWSGLIEYDLETGDQVLYTAENTQNALLPPIGDEQRTRISGLSFDQDENLWISCFGAGRPLAVRSNEGTWHNFAVPGDNKLSDLAIDELGNIWGVISGNSGAVIVYDYGADINDPTDDQSRQFNINNSQLPSNLVNCIARDLDGSIWVGTGAGAIVFDCGGAVFEDICQGSKPKVFIDDLGAFLLESEDVLSIAVDGANRKWFGTRNGIFVQSPSGEEEVARFNTGNSPLFDDNIKALAYNGRSGEMMIATNKGLQSYRTETTEARLTHSSNVYAFPNPVRPEYRGPIAIKGLARDAEVKITDINGQLVFQTDALGGQAIWDGRDALGRDVAGGIYLVFSSSSDAFRDPDTAVTKILVVR